MLLFQFLSDRCFKVQDPSSKSRIACFTCHLEMEIAGNVSNSTFKRSTFVISYHRLQHRGQEKEFLSHEHYFIIDNAVVHHGFIDLKV